MSESPEFEVARVFTAARGAYAASWWELGAALLCSCAVQNFYSGGGPMWILAAAGVTYSAVRARAFERRWIRITDHTVAWRDQWCRRITVPRSDVTLSGYDQVVDFEIQTPKGRFRVEHTILGYDELLARLRREIPLDTPWPAIKIRQGQARIFRNHTPIAFLLLGAFVFWFVTGMPSVMSAIENGQWLTAIGKGAPCAFFGGWTIGTFFLERIELGKDRLRWFGPLGIVKLDVPLGSIRSALPVENRLYQGLIDTDEGTVPVSPLAYQGEELLAEVRRIGLARTAHVAAEVRRLRQSESKN